MKHLSTASKTVALLFSAALLVACTGSDTKKEDEEAARLAEEQAAIYEAQQIAQQAEQSAELAGLEEAAAAVGNVFYFEYDSSTLTPEALSAVDAHIALLHRNTENIRLEGHTDERGTREYNMALGERRANSVRDYMVANGISSLRIETISYGEERPLAYGSGEASWAENRRVVLKPQ
ncbi:Outer membrane lipoprotein Omp16 [Halioglobus japonicus]|nr:Outer membrane lipoprotein Omp16 [Halioglobus japonicus]